MMVELTAAKVQGIRAWDEASYEEGVGVRSISSRERSRLAGLLMASPTAIASSIRRGQPQLSAAEAHHHLLSGQGR
jgi:hypothetical protein